MAYLADVEGDGSSDLPELLWQAAHIQRAFAAEEPERALGTAFPALAEVPGHVDPLALVRMYAAVVDEWCAYPHSLVHRFPADCPVAA